MSLDMDINGNIPSREDIIKRAESLIPIFKDRALEAEQDRKLPKKNIDDLFNSGLMRIYQPKRYGGYSMGWATHADAARVIARGCPSSAWIVSVVGAHAAHMAVGMGADVWVLDNNPDTLEKHWQQFGRSTNTVFSTQSTVEEYVLKADLVIGGVLIPGAEAPKLVTKEMIKAMKPGSVVVDVAIDQGGCFETSQATTHADPTYVVDDVVHYCVANMPGGVPKTSTFALNNVTLPFAIDIANKGVKQALLDDEHLRAGLNVHKGKVTCLEVAEDLGYEYVSALDALKN